MGSALEFQRIRISHAAIGQRWCSLVCRLFDTFDKDVRGVFAVQEHGRCYVQDLPDERLWNAKVRWLTFARAAGQIRQAI